MACSNARHHVPFCPCGSALPAHRLKLVVIPDAGAQCDYREDFKKDPTWEPPKKQRGSELAGRTLRTLTIKQLHDVRNSAS